MWMVLHVLLPLSATLQFPLPVRVRKGERGWLYKQYVLHNLLFSARSAYFYWRVGPKGRGLAALGGGLAAAVDACVASEEI